MSKRKQKHQREAVSNDRIVYLQYVSVNFQCIIFQFHMKLSVSWAAL